VLPFDFPGPTPEFVVGLIDIVSLEFTKIIWEE